MADFELAEAASGGELKSKVDAKVRTTGAVESELHPGRFIPAGSEGFVVDVSERPEGYHVEFKVSDEDFDVVTLEPDQFEVIDPPA